jgi:N-acetylglucosamine transport system substrate-binding protein
MRKSACKLLSCLSFLLGLLIGLLSGGCTLRPHSDHSVTTVEVAVFEGGYGIEWHKQMARQYERLHPGIRINLWGDPRVDEKIKPRILRGNPPDLANCTIPVWKLIVAGKLVPLDSTLDSPAYGPNGTLLPATWRSTLAPGILTAFEYQGKAYAMPSNLSAWVCWYDKKQFREHGWKPPQTWTQFMALCEQMKRAGVTPIAFQGKYAGGYGWPTLLSLYERLVPLTRWYAAQDMAPNAFLDPEFIHAARLLQDMARVGFGPGAMAMSHTESQMQWANGREAMVFCGLWLEHEMAQSIPNGFEMSCFPVPTIPSVEGGQGDQRAVYGGGAENFFVFKDALHAREALDFLKYMLSQEAAQSYVRQLNTLSPVNGATKSVAVSPALRSAVEILDGRSRLFDDRLSGLYLDFGKTVMPDSMSDLLSQKITPDQFAHRLQASIDQIRANPDVYKPPPQGVP